MLSQLSQLPDVPPRRRRGQGHQSRRALEEDRQLATRLAIDEIRALDMFQGDRALALRLQEEEARNVVYDPFPLPRVDHQRLGAEHERVNIRTQSWALPVFLRNRPRLDLERMTGNLDLVSAARRALSRVRVATPSRRVLLAATASPVARIRHSLSQYSFSRHECVTCMERIHGVAIRAPCGHYYDEECIRQLFDAANRDESLFPPRCCRRPIPLTSVWGNLTDELRSTFEEKRKEFSVQNRVYCAKPNCSRFLAEQQDRGRLRDYPSRKCPAPGCGTITCLRCRNEVKSGSKHLCLDNEVDKTAIALARDCGWRRCPGCSNVVELNHGCYHMTCRCKTQFCYLCGGRWKTCDCTQWEERELVEEQPVAAPIRQHRERPHPILVPPPLRPPTPITIRRDRSLPLVPDAPREPGGSRVRQEGVRSTIRQQRRAYRIIPFPRDEDDPDPNRFIMITYDNLEEPEIPVAGPSRRRVSRNVSSSPTVRDSLELPSLQHLRTAGCAHEAMGLRSDMSMMVTCDRCEDEVTNIFYCTDCRTTLCPSCRTTNTRRRA